MNLIFDIGYNTGKFTRAVQEKFDATVVAVEANKSLCDVGDNEKLILYNALAANVDDMLVDFYIDKKHPGISTASVPFMLDSRFKRGSKNLRKNVGRWGDPIKVNTITLDTLIFWHGVPDLIKIDVEGYEYNVLRGLTKMAKDICFEWREEDADVMFRCVDYLSWLGYEKFGVIGWFDEGDVFEKATYAPSGDPYLEYPEMFYKFDDLDIHDLIKPDRRINYGMLFAIPQ